MESSAKSDARARERWARRPPPDPPAPGPSGRLASDDLPAPDVLERPTTAERARRAINVVMAAVGLIAAAPLMLVIAILVKATSSGPVLYAQKRVGYDRRRGDGRSPPSGNGSKPEPDDDRRHRDRGGRVFTIYKFRTMYDGTGEDQVWARPDDDRVTPVGRVLRKLHLDELPQLYNVLRGDMNVVGPRPEQPRIFSDIARKIPTYRLRQRVRPGITGWAQLHHHYDRDLDDVRRKLELDLEYLEHRSPLEDVKIALRTVPAVLTEEADGW